MFLKEEKTFVFLKEEKNFVFLKEEKNSVFLREKVLIAIVSMLDWLSRPILL